MRRRQFLQATALAALASSATSQAAEVPQELTVRTGPYLQNPAPGAMTVMWLTSVPAYGYVEYGPTPNLGLRAEADADGMHEANTTVHRVRLSGIAPGSRCYYRAVSHAFERYEPYRIALGPAVASSVYDFRTPSANAEKLRFLVFNDLHDNVKLWRDLYRLVEKEEEVDFVFLNGDVTDTLVDERQLVDHFLTVCTELFATRVPFLYARGNHETRGAFCRQMRHYLDLPGDRYYYAQTHGPARLVVLDTGEDKRDDSPVYAGLCAFDAYRDQQRAWLETELKSPAWADAAQRIVIHHIPAFYNDPADLNHPDNHTAGQLLKTWHPLINAAKPSVYLGAHTHLPTIQPACDAHAFPIVIGGGPRRGIGTVMVVDVTATSLSVKMLGDSGKTIGNVRA